MINPMIAHESDSHWCRNNHRRNFNGRVVVGEESRLSKPATILAALILLLLNGTAWAQKNQPIRIVDTIWGFDGRVVAGQFAPLSVLIDNLSDQPIEATARLRRVTGMVNEVGGVALQPVFLGPNSRRWVQFYPYIVDQTVDWYFDLQTEEETFRFDPISQPRAVYSQNMSEKDAEQSMPAVILDPAGMTTRSPTTIKHMPAEIFPPYATATTGLYALFLDHVPDWEAPRQEALLSWLKSGGRLYLLRDSNNQTLRFSGALSALNEPFPEFPVGNGNVTRHEIQRNELVIQLVARAVAPPGMTESDNEETAMSDPQPPGFRSSEIVEDDRVFSLLRDITRPDHSWGLIFLLSICYVGLIFPGCWMLSKQRTLHFLVTYGSIAGLAMFFSLVFLLIGRRGYGESTSVHTLAIARSEDETHWSSLQYNSLFVTSGDQYRIEEENRQSLLASGSSNERVDALITSGNNASFISRIPPFSSQSMISRRRIVSDDWNLSVVDFAQAGTDLTQLTITFGDKFPVAENSQYFAVHGKKIYKLQMDAGKRQLSRPNSVTTLATFCNRAKADNFGMALTPGGFGTRIPQSTEQDPVKQFFEDSLPTLVARSLADDFVDKVDRFTLPAGRIRLLVYAPVPASFELPLTFDVRRDGRILFVREMPLATSASGSLAE
jgi:hypothetical protein